MTYTRLYNSIRNLLSPRQPEDDEPYDDEEDTGAPERGDIEQLAEDGLPADRAAARVRRGSAASYRIKHPPHWRTGVRNRGTRGGLPKEHQNPVLSKSAANFTATDTRYGQKLRNIFRSLGRRRRGFTGRGGGVYAGSRTNRGRVIHVSKTKMKKGSKGSVADTANPRNRNSRRRQHVVKKLLEAAKKSGGIDPRSDQYMKRLKDVERNWSGRDPNWKEQRDTDPKKQRANDLRDKLRKTKDTCEVDLKPGTQE